MHENQAMPGVTVRLPPRYHGGIKASLATACQFAVHDAADGLVAISPAEGAGAVRNYFAAHKLADAQTDLSDDATWVALATHPPYETPAIQLPEDFEVKMAERQARSDLPSLVERLNVRASLADPLELTSLLRKELPSLFAKYPYGSLWYVSVDETLMKRIAALRVLLQFCLTPDVQSVSNRSITYFGAHQLTHGTMFADAIQLILLSFPPTTFGFTMSTPPGALVFLFGEFADLRVREPGNLARAFVPGVHQHPSVQGIKVPVELLAPAHLEAMLAWWTTRLNTIYSHAADPTRFALPTGQHAIGEQAAWFLTIERMLADFGAVAAAVDSPGLLRLQGAFDALDKAASLLHGNSQEEAAVFKGLLSRERNLSRVKEAYRRLPLQLQPRFSQWAQITFDRFYAEILGGTMEGRVTPTGVIVGRTFPDDLHEVPTDEYVATLVREARNASHGLMEILAEPRKAGKTQRRLLLATNRGEVPSTFYDLMRVIVFALLADAEALCDRTWWR